jgi:hypothetical protein
MRKSILAGALAAVAIFGSTAPGSAQSLFNGYLRLDPMGVDRPPAPEPNARRGSRQVYKPIRGNYPPCVGFIRTGDRCRLPTGQVCMVYDFGLGACV